MPLIGEAAQCSYTCDMRQAFIYPGENGQWVAEVPSLPGCISQGATKEDAMANVKEAIDLYVQTLADEKRPIPHHET